MHFHGHNDFGLATASAVAAVRAGARWIHGTINGMGERAGQREPRRGRARAAARSTASRSNLRLDRVREVSERVRELSGYELEPWKPVVGETLFRRESGAVASQFHDPPSIEPYSSELVGAERAIVLGKKSGIDSIRIKAEELGLDVAEERQRELLAQVKELGTREARPRHRRRVPRARRVADYDAVIVGSGINSLACGALLARAGWRRRACSSATTGSAARSRRPRSPSPASCTTSSAPGIRSGSAARRTRSSATSSRARGLEYLNTELPTATALPRRRGGVPAPQRRRERRGARPPRAGDGDAWRRCSTSSSRTPTSRSACSAPSSGRGAARRSARKACRRLGRGGLAEFSGEPARRRAATGSSETFASERAHGLLAPWVLHTGLGPDAAASGFMTQVIAVAVQEGGMPIPRGGGARLVDALVRADRATTAARARPGVDVERVLVQDGARGRRPHRRRRDGRARRAP